MRRGRHQHGRRRFLRWLRDHRRKHRGPHPPFRARWTLADIPPGKSARVRGFLWMSASNRERLQSYGLSEGHFVHVLQQSPVTVIQAGHTEIAIEDDLARAVLVEVE